MASSSAQQQQPSRTSWKLSANVAEFVPSSFAPPAPAQPQPQSQSQPQQQQPAPVRNSTALNPSSVEFVPRGRPQLNPDQPEFVPSSAAVSAAAAPFYPSSSPTNAYRASNTTGGGYGDEHHDGEDGGLQAGHDDEDEHHHLTGDDSHGHDDDHDDGHDGHDDGQILAEHLHHQLLLGEAEADLLHEDYGDEDAGADGHDTAAEDSMYGQHQHLGHHGHDHMLEEGDPDAVGDDGMGGLGLGGMGMGMGGGKLGMAGAGSGLRPDQMVYPGVPALIAPEPTELSRPSRRGGLLRPPHSFFVSPQLYQEMAWRRACRLQLAPPEVRAMLPPSFGPPGQEDQYHSVLPLEQDASPQAQHRVRQQQAIMVGLGGSAGGGGSSGNGGAGGAGSGSYRQPGGNGKQAAGAVAAKPVLRTEIMLDSPFDFDPCVSEFDSASSRVISLTTGEALLCRRILRCRMPEDRIQLAIAPWRRLLQQGEASPVPAMVGLRDCFNCPTWRDGDSLCLIYDFHPGAQSLQHKYFNPQQSQPQPLSDTVLWSYLCQLLTLVQSVHATGHCCRGMLVPKRVLVCEQNRLRVMGCGLADLLQGPPRRPMQQMQMVDLMCIGRLMLCLATGDPNAPRQAANSFRLVEARYGLGLSRMISRLLGALQQPPGSVSAAMLCSEAGPHLAQECSRLYNHADRLYHELEKEFENGRMLRLLVKLGFINERPSFQGHARWSETGDRFLLKLLRNFIFHQTNPDGTANVDLGHVANVLNKLDAGVPQQVVLASPAAPPGPQMGMMGGPGSLEDSLIVASFAQLRAAVNDAFEALSKDAARGGAGAPPGLAPDMAGVNPHVFEQHLPHHHQQM